MLNRLRSTLDCGVTGEKPELVSLHEIAVAINQVVPAVLMAESG